MIIGLTGFKGCGKSTVAEILEERMGYKIRSFATPIKDMLKVMGLTHEELYDPELKEKVMPDFGKSPREIMQLLGTEFARNMLSKDVWVTALMRQLNDEDNYVIDDVRFPNEAAAIHARGGKVVRVVRPADPSKADNHISEQGLNTEQIDYELQNLSCYRTDLEFATIRTLEEVFYYGAIFDPESKRISSQ
jgi:ATPase subunit of ABC transporter with duplicated ATPase domains